MIQPLRTRHLRMFVILAIILPLLFAAALAVRGQPPAPLVIPSVGGTR